MAVFESDVCIIGGGISAAMLSKKLLELRPDLSINVVEAGRRLFDLENRMEYRRRSLMYGENAWPGDFIEDQKAAGVISRTMAAGGSALHWGGTCNRFSEEDLKLKSLYGLYTDWPIEWRELEKFYCEAERRLGVSGEPSPLREDWRSEPYPMSAMVLSHNLIELKKWGERSGIPFWSTPQAKNTKPYDDRAQCIRCNTCLICPTGARYSPDFTYKQLLKNKKFALHDQTLVRRLQVDDHGRVSAASAVHQERPEEQTTFRAPLFVVASGYTWSSHLLLLSQTTKYPNGVANSSGLVGRYMCGHEFITAIVELDAKIYPGMNETHALISRQFFRCKTDEPYVRHDLRIWDSSTGREPRLRGSNGDFLLGDELLNDWRNRAQRGAARVRGYYDIHPDRNSSLTLDASTTNRWGDPLPKIEHRLDAATVARQPQTRQHFETIFERLAQNQNGKVLSSSEGGYLDHPAGGCRMGTDPATSVCDSFGQTHDHENLFVVGSPTLPSAGCTNGTLTFVALTLRSAEQIAKQFKGGSKS